MRVALLTNFIPPYRVSLFRALQKEVGELRIFISTAMEQNRSWTPEWGDLDVVVQRSASIRRTWRTESFEEPYELHVPYDTISQLRKFHPAVIITGELGARSLQAVMYARAAQIPVVLWATLSDHTEQGRGALRNSVRRMVIPRFDAVIVNGAAGERYIRRFRSDAPLHVPYTTDMEPFFALPIDRPGNSLLFVGSLTERKGVRMLLDAANEWAAQHLAEQLELVMIGEGPLERELKSKPHLPNLSVVWAGHVPYDELPHWYGASRTVIFPTLADEWGMVVNEALASGVPVLGSLCSQAVEELIEDGVNGWTFQPDNAGSLAVQIARALKTVDPALLRMRAAARDSARSLAPETAALKMAELLKAL